MTNKQAAKQYRDLAKRIADAINDLNDARNTASYLNEQAKDNGDPVFMLDDALAKLAPALAMVVSYSAEYGLEDPDKDTTAK